jgi:hypothetical protein
MEQASQSKQGSELGLSVPQELSQPLSSRPDNFVAETLSKSDREASSTALAPDPYHAKFSEEVHNYVREYIRNADQKAGFFFAGLTALLAFLYGHGGTDHWRKPLQAWNIFDVFSFVAMTALGMQLPSTTPRGSMLQKYSSIRLRNL